MEILKISVILQRECEMVAGSPLSHSDAYPKIPKTKVAMDTVTNSVHLRVAKDKIENKHIPSGIKIQNNNQY